MDFLFTSLTDALYGNAYVALGAAFTWGVLSILLSPCHLSSIPLVIGFLISEHKRKTSESLLFSFLFAVGILATVAIIGIITAWLGRIMGDIGWVGKYLFAAVFFVVGLYLMDIIRIPAIGTGVKRMGVQSAYFSALLLGLMFGAALGPCTFAFMAPVLGVVFQMSGTNVLGAGALLLSFGLGHCLVIALAGGSLSYVQSYLDWSTTTTAVLWTKRAAGFLVVLAGIYALYSI